MTSLRYRNPTALLEDTGFHIEYTRTRRDSHEVHDEVLRDEGPAD
jgi:hypothetical protein